MREFVEGGVSGFKVSASKRDALIEIKAMAQRKEFDVLGIYMSDRLGRIADETPLVISFLNNCGIKIVSYCEGEISATNHTDKLMTYIRYWQAEGESLKTSARVRDAVEQLVKQGKWRGGATTYGYKSVSRGTLNFKGKPIFDVEIDSEQAEVVRQIFKLYTTENYGVKGIARYLNDKEIPSDEGLMWSGSIVDNLLKNKIYIGIYELGKQWRKNKSLQSPIMQNFVIIDECTFLEAQRILSTKSPNVVRTTRRGSLLLTGLIYCGDCGNKLTSMYPREYTLKNGVKTAKDRSYYRCRSYLTPKSTQGRCSVTMHRAEKIEKLVADDIRAFILDIDREKLLGSFNDVLVNQLKEAQEQVKKINLSAKQCEKETLKLKEEVMKVIMGQSSFSQELLSSMLATKENELVQLQDKQIKKQEEIADIETQISKRKGIVEELDTWSQRYEQSNLMDKKAMIINIIDKITIHKEAILIDYKIQIKNQDIQLEQKNEEHTIKEYIGNIDSYSNNMTSLNPTADNNSTNNDNLSIIHLSNGVLSCNLDVKRSLTMMREPLGISLLVCCLIRLVVSLYIKRAKI